jgi:hypothetical protein
MIDTAPDYHTAARHRWTPSAPAAFERDAVYVVTKIESEGRRDAAIRKSLGQIAASITSTWH